MISQWIANLTPKRIVIYLVMIAVAIYIVWYVIDALEGFDPDFKPSVSNNAASASGAGAGTEKGGNEFFDPTKKPLEASPAK